MTVGDVAVAVGELGGLVAILDNAEATDEPADQHHRLHPLNHPISHASSARARRASQAAGKVARRQPGARCFA
jgi:hypothetical protein